MSAAASATSQYVLYEVGDLVLSGLAPTPPLAWVRAASWHNRLRRLGLHLPLFVVHDLGMLLAKGATSPDDAPSDSPRVAVNHDALTAVGADRELVGLVEAYAEFLSTLVESEVIEKAAAWRLSDDLIAVILARLLTSLYSRWPERGGMGLQEELPLDPNVYASVQITVAWKAFERSRPVSFLRLVVSSQLHLFTGMEQIDLDTLRMLGMLGDHGAGSFMDVADLFAVFNSAEANDVVNFSLDLLPSILETRRATGAQTFSVDGYASIERKGHIDNLVLTEMVYDDDVFWQKFADNELFYYGRDKQREERKRLHYIVTDASASMRGARTVFGRGLALTLVKKLTMLGERVYFRFFDSALHPLVKMDSANLSAPYLLSFKSEMGRNYTKVFSELSVELRRLRREEGGSITLYIITHGQAHVPVEVMEALSKHAYIYGVFILPSRDIELEYLPVLDRHHVVDAATLQSREQRRDKALEIVEEAADHAEGITVG